MALADHGRGADLPFYLVHQSLGIPLAREITHHVPELGHWVTMGVVLAAMLLLSWLIYRLVDRPVGSWMRRRLTLGLRLDAPDGTAGARQAWGRVRGTV
ncbi:hypothetical protein ACFQZC_18635 [Streptacidiphilus monticola]